MCKALTLLLPFLLLLVTGAQTLRLSSPMISCFSQATAESGMNGSNCASIAIIKLAMRKYGIHNLFINVDHVGSEYRVTLHNGVKVNIAQQELSEVEKYDHFVPRGGAKGAISDTLKEARFAYAVMAKRHQIDKKLPNIRAAVYEVSKDGEYYYIVNNVVCNAKLLGVSINGKSIAEEGMTSIGDRHDIIVVSYYHAAYGDAGMYDEYGEPVEYRYFEKYHSSQIKVFGFLNRLVQHQKTRIDSLYTIP